MIIQDPNLADILAHSLSRPPVSLQHLSPPLKGQRPVFVAMSWQRPSYGSVLHHFRALPHRFRPLSSPLPMLSRPATGGQPGAEPGTHTAPRLDSQHPHAMSCRRQVGLGRGRGVREWGRGRARGQGGKAHDDRMPIYHDVMRMYESTTVSLACSIPARPSNATATTTWCACVRALVYCPWLRRCVMCKRTMAFLA